MPSKPARILVVEDEEALRTAIGQALTQAGFVVDTAPDGENFAERLARFRPDAAVLDISPETSVSPPCEDAGSGGPETSGSAPVLGVLQ
jgi:DNA-binding response OmpR family regulator